MFVNSSRYFGSGSFEKSNSPISGAADEILDSSGAAGPIVSGIITIAATKGRGNAVAQPTVPIIGTAL